MGPRGPRPLLALFVALFFVVDLFLEGHVEGLAPSPKTEEAHSASSERRTELLELLDVGPDRERKPDSQVFVNAKELE